MKIILKLTKVLIGNLVIIYHNCNVSITEYEIEIKLLFLKQLYW